MVITTKDSLVQDSPNKNTVLDTKTRLSDSHTEIDCYTTPLANCKSPDISVIHIIHQFLLEFGHVLVLITMFMLLAVHFSIADVIDEVEFATDYQLTAVSGDNTDHKTKTKSQLKIEVVTLLAFYHL